MRSFLRRPAMGRLTFITMFALYIVLFLNIAFFKQAWILLPVNTPYNGLIFLTMVVVAFCVMHMLITLASFLCLERPIITLFILLSACAQYFILTFGIIIDRSMVTNIVDTTAAESYALMSVRMTLTIALSGVLIVAIAWWIKIKPAASFRKGLVRRLISIVISVLVLMLIALMFYKDYASLFRNHKLLVKSLNPSNSIVAINSWYKHSQTRHLPLVRIGTDAKPRADRQSGPRKNLTILIVGETSRAENFSLGGYSRETNPLLSKDNIVYFPQMTSCGTVTAVSVPCMFSNMPRKQYKESLAQHQEGLLDVVQHAGIKVLWNENDGGCKGVCNRVSTQDMTALKLPGKCINGECYDEVLFHNLENYIDNLDQDGIVVLHTIGSHGPTYYNRYPPQFRRFMPTCDTNEIQECSQEQLINTYDNTILYTDYIVDKTIRLLQAKQDKFTTSLVYLSDHGESLGENGVYLHGLPYSIAPVTQKHVPMVMWLSDDYQQRYGVNYACLKKRAAENAYSQDNLFSTMLGIMGIETQEYHRQDDVLTPCRDNAK